MSIETAANKWKISHRRVQTLCSELRIPGAIFIGNMWILPNNTVKPIDARTLDYKLSSISGIKPFVKWSGGKGQLLRSIERMSPKGLGVEITKYAEPFVGGGAVLFNFLRKYHFDEVYISDVNKALIETYKTIRDSLEDLKELLYNYQSKYSSMEEKTKRDYYYSMRTKYNEIITKDVIQDEVELSALFIFLNKTCFNGVYRVNASGEFNVPPGVYKNPTICDEENLDKISLVLETVNIECRDYHDSLNFMDERTFAYFDPPYRPLSLKNTFVGYTASTFDDNSQYELANFIKKIDSKGVKFLLSNSDPKNTNPNDDFFEELYSKYSISRVGAMRTINSNAEKRGRVSELLINNY